MRFYVSMKNINKPLGAILTNVENLPYTRYNINRKAVNYDRQRFKIFRSRI